MEGDEEVRHHPLRRRRSRLSGVRYLSPATMVVLGVTQMLGEVMDAAAQGQVVEAGHFLRVALRGVGEHFAAPGVSASAAFGCGVVI